MKGTGVLSRVMQSGSGGRPLMRVELPGQNQRPCRCLCCGAALPSTPLAATLAGQALVTGITSAALPIR